MHDCARHTDHEHEGRRVRGLIGLLTYALRRSATYRGVAAAAAARCSRRIFMAS